MMQDFEVEIAEKQKALAEYNEIVKDLEKELLMVIKNTEIDNWVLLNTHVSFYCISCFFRPSS